MKFPKPRGIAPYHAGVYSRKEVDGWRETLKDKLRSHEKFVDDFEQGQYFLAKELLEEWLA